MSDSLPSPRDLLAALLAQLPHEAPAGPDAINPLQHLAPRHQKLFVTLHCIFPNELLPALDLLDRRLVTRLLLPEALRGGDPGSNSVYYVRSSQPPSRSRFQSGARTSYEVRLTSWNCTCPAFTFAVFGAGSAEVSADSKAAADPRERVASGVGGMTTGDGVPPVCKHLLACLLTEKCGGLLEHQISELEATREELAGWATGWGG
ncbi:MAG: hypothetical protein M1838_000152 [Thelocarpon superellum]|nr:MAG: hypothetical protein M1838_000152 [Thelocarpon superellum]